MVKLDAVNGSPWLFYKQIALLQLIFQKYSVLDAGCLRYKQRIALKISKGIENTI